MKNWLISSIVLYIFAMMIYAIWSYLAFVNVDKMEWVGSLLYLPHGVRVIGICYFGYKYLPALYMAEISGPILVYPEQYFDVWPYASLASLAGVVLACEIVKWSGSNIKGSLITPINFTNYRALVLVIILSALFNSIGSNLITSYLADVDLHVHTIARFFIGDVIGASILILFLSACFTSLKRNRLIKLDS